MIIYNEQFLLCSDNVVIYVMISFIKDFVTHFLTKGNLESTGLTRLGRGTAHFSFSMLS